MKNQGYSSFEEWKTDLNKINKNPNDNKFIAYVVGRVERSSNDIQDKVKSYLSDRALETNPWMVFEQIIKENPGYILLTKTKEDPWFNAG